MPLDAREDASLTVHVDPTRAQLEAWLGRASDERLVCAASSEGPPSSVLEGRSMDLEQASIEALGTSGVRHAEHVGAIRQIGRVVGRPFAAAGSLLDRVPIRWLEAGRRSVGVFRSDRRIHALR